MANLFSKLNELLDDYKRQQIIKRLYETQQEEQAKPIDKNYATLWDYAKENSSGSKGLFNFEDDIPSYEVNFDTFNKEQNDNQQI